MADRRTVFLVSKQARQRAHALIDAAPEGFVMRLSEPTRTETQNRKLWPSIAELQRQLPDLAKFSANDIKLRLLNALGAEMRFLPELEGQGLFPVGFRSSELTVEQFSALLDLIHVYGSKRGVQFKETV